MSSGKKCEKGVERLSLLQMWGVQHKQKHNVGFNSCHQLQIKCGFKEQMSAFRSGVL